MSRASFMDSSYARGECQHPCAHFAREQRSRDPEREGQAVEEDRLAVVAAFELQREIAQRVTERHGLAVEVSPHQTRGQHRDSPLSRGQSTWRTAMARPTKAATA